jgi:hypothetical protein
VLALRLKVVEDATCKTFWVDGESLGYNPAYLALNDHECRGVLAHEILHVAGGHCFRQGRATLNCWNDACDYAINPIVRQAGMALPPGCLDDPRFYGRSAEEIYAVLTQEARQKEQEKSGGKPGANAPGGQQAPANGANTPSAAPDQSSTPSCGEVRPYPEASDKAVKEAEWQVATLQAAKAAQMREQTAGRADRGRGSGRRGVGGLAFAPHAVRAAGDPRRLQLCDAQSPVSASRLLSAGVA